jgi:hypothetical protein
MHTPFEQHKLKPVIWHRKQIQLTKQCKQSQLTNQHPNLAYFTLTITYFSLFCDQPPLICFGVCGRKATTDNRLEADCGSEGMGFDPHSTRAKAK